MWENAVSCAMARPRAWFWFYMGNGSQLHSHSLASVSSSLMQTFPEWLSCPKNIHFLRPVHSSAHCMATVFPRAVFPWRSVASCHLESAPGLPVRTFWDGRLSSFSHNFHSCSLGTCDYLPVIPTGAMGSHFPGDQGLGCHCSSLLHGNHPFVL